MENRTINIGVVAEVAEALEELKDQVVFVGGAVVSVYADDPAADEIRPTGDIDMTLNLMSFASWAKVQERLAQLEFYPDPEGHSICSYKYKDIPVDIMTGEDGHLGPANRWYKIGFENLKTVVVKEQEISVYTAPCYLATKFEAFSDRGSDYRTSHDFEDIVYVIDNRTDIVREVKEDHPEIIAYLQEEIEKVLSHPNKEEIISAHLHPIIVDERSQVVEEKMRSICRF